MFKSRAKPQVAKPTGTNRKKIIKTLLSSQTQHVAVGRKHARMLEIWEQAIRKYLEEQASIIGAEAAARAWYDQTRPYMTIPGKKLTATDIQYLKKVFEVGNITVEGAFGLEADWLMDNPEYEYVRGRRVPRDTPHSEAPLFMDSLVRAIEADSPSLPAEGMEVVRQGLVSALSLIRVQVNQHHGDPGPRELRRRILWGALLTEFRNRLPGYDKDEKAFQPHGDLPPVV